MPDKAFFDTNVLIYAAVEGDPRSVRARELLASAGVISVQVLNEFVSVAHRKMKMPWADVRLALQWALILCPGPVPITVDLHQQAIRIAEQYGYGIYDCLIVAAALQARCTTLYSQDMHDGQVIDARLTIANPVAS